VPQAPRVHSQPGHHMAPVVVSVVAVVVAVAVAVRFLASLQIKSMMTAGPGRIVVASSLASKNSFHVVASV